ncbi:MULTISPECIES: glycine--tRNA ligase subunit beta [unclassified Sphingopyxis]|uniref:glycine--tRNA ligase subunit beta n=1 Tax=unclassified Sphingopyxis TaxID=2614943 RepID=UPI000735EF5F|nr:MULTISPECIES: glycine--tRNA ligase subunit beta [unclassified Sphingopyxis]KTE27757.1 glycine--tRNA ligase subunit beta [Sphingopyxis sp. HIX]KTE76691.1 glycine--tRNA ligase subunit beta [Sphingopyxis sp. HXXIV]
MTDFLLELRSEEIPARMQANARFELRERFSDTLHEAGLVVSDSDITVWSTPRRLTLIARNLPDATAAVSEELKGPRSSAPPQALEGFLRKTGLTQDQLEDRDGVYFAVIDKPGRATAAVLAEAIPAIVRGFAWPKSMRWGKESASSESLRWVRPLSGIVAIFGEELVPCEVSGISAGFATRGHRFHCPGEITIGSAADYAEKLRACHVIVDHEERQAIIRDGAAKAAADAGLSLVEDEGLVIENAGLTEWPVPLLGRFDTAFLEVPPEVIQLTARVNQKYFVVNGADGKLANGFVCTANIDAKDGGKEVVAGNQKVLAARLSDARFFWEQDLAHPLETYLPKLEAMLLYEGMGSLREKAERISILAGWIAEQYFPERDPDTARRAGLLAKADLATGMVGEFPELQGVMGGYYAERGGEKPGTVSALQQQYVAAVEGCIPACVALADRIDTLALFFARNIKPTGSRDPFALRRAALQTIQTILVNDTRLNLKRVVEKSHEIAKRNAAIAGNMQVSDSAALASDLLDFFADRLKVQQREAGVRHDLIDAVFVLGGEDDLVRLLARVKALQAFMATEDGTNLLAGYKRAANILKQAGEVSGTAAATPPTEADATLLAALDTAEPAAATAVADERFTDAMAALASLRAPIDAFFEGVMVNDPDEAVRAYRLGLLARFTGAVHGVADFSKIEG